MPGVNPTKTPAVWPAAGAKACLTPGGIAMKSPAPRVWISSPTRMSSCPEVTWKNSVALVWKCTGAPAAPSSKVAVLQVSSAVSVSRVMRLPGASLMASAVAARVAISVMSPIYGPDRPIGEVNRGSVRPVNSTLVTMLIMARPGL